MTETIYKFEAGNRYNENVFVQLEIMSKIRLTLEQTEVVANAMTACEDLFQELSETNAKLAKMNKEEK